MGLKGSLPVILIAILTIPIFLFTIFPLIGATTNSMSGLYLFSQAWNSQTGSRLNVGYYGLCWKNLGDTKINGCIGTTSKSAQDVAKKFFDMNQQGIDDIIAGIQLALDLQRKVFVAFMTAGGLAWFVSLILVGLIIVAKGNAGASWRAVATVFAYAGAVLMIASAWSTTSGVRALEVVTLKDVKAGTTLLALQWVAAILATVHAWAVSRVSSSSKKEDVYSYSMGR
ncbi:hypothetical protein K461DRAFT_281115 [Myriangium duriaei CBS 260.36]|uniref:Uncharacterized protein n=1 Tax=Myriangium duriaei CBS 260.36 TaxID=1168546 RepID=A0A9P4ITU8_9PEZI|nr:hypothetical protein K461DRAFT_281115 [Myriangium duriaei CBS 260.36]